MIQFYCPACRGGIEADEEDYGHKVNCPHCNASVSVPAKEPVPRNPIASRFWWYDFWLRALLLIGFFMMLFGIAGMFFSRQKPVCGHIGIVGSILFVGALVLMFLNSIRAKMDQR